MKASQVVRAILIGKRYGTITDIREQARYLTMSAIFFIAIFPLVAIGFTAVGLNPLRAILDFSLAAICLGSIILIRTKVPLKFIPVIPVILCGAYFCFLLYDGGLNLWVAVWLFAYPPIAFFLCKMKLGIIDSFITLIFMFLVLFTPFTNRAVIFEVRIRFISAYILILGLTIIYEWISVLKDRKETRLNAQLAQERDIIQSMKDNIQQGIFMMDSELKILPLYSRPLISILSYYDSELAGKSFLDILSASLEVRQLHLMKGFFTMMFEKSKSAKVLESANPISEFEYKIDDRTKTLSTRFSLVEQSGMEPMIIGIIQDITREKEFDLELRAQKEAREIEMKNMFDVIQIDPLVFQDFVDDTETGFDRINSVLKDKSLSEKQVVTKFYQSVHAIKSNAQILGLDTFAEKLHKLEDAVKAVSAMEEITPDNILSLALSLESIMQEKDNYLKIVRKIEAFKSANQIDSVLVHSLARAVEKISGETNKRVALKAGALDKKILESKLRRPIKEILLQCIRNSIYHGIEIEEERIRKNKKAEGLLVFSIKNNNGNAEVTYSDDGGGLDWKKIKQKYMEITSRKNPGGKNAPDKKTLLSSIFLPEFSTAERDSVIAGRGIGLSLVRDIVKENHGSIKVDSTEAGLTFRFIFPLAG